MDFGLQESDLAYIIAVLEKFPEIEKAIIFGSRAKGNYQKGSDIDIAVAGEGVSFTTVASIHACLEEEGPLPYFIDVVDYTHLTHSELQSHIDRVGKTIFERKMRQ